MSWLHDHAPELNAMAGIFMNCATLIIIYFNLNQLRQNSRSLNVDINFKVFDLRKKLFKDIQAFLKGLTSNNGFSQHFVVRESGNYDCSTDFLLLQESIDNYKYLFSKQFSLQLELLSFKLEKGIEVEYQISKLKNKDPSSWTIEDQQEIHALGDKSKDIMHTVLAFDLDGFLPYLNVANFHANLMQDDTNITPQSKIQILLSSLTILKHFIVGGLQAIFKRRSYRSV